MKPKFTPIKAMAAAFICCSVLGHTSYAEVKPVTKLNISKSEDPEDDKKPSRKTKNKTASFVSLNNNSVKIYPDIIKREMHVIAKENDGKEISFFVFDVNGTLVQQYKMKSKDHYRVSGLKKGTYVYRVFSDDQETATGKFEIR
mgnify:CR=1 FL=1